MPTYEYKCTKCKKKFELLQRITAPPVKNRQLLYILKLPPHGS